MFSVTPSPFFQPYTLAVSKKFTPASRARSMILCESASVVNGPKFMVPRHRRLTFSPVRPSCAYCMDEDVAYAWPAHHWTAVSWRGSLLAMSSFNLSDHQNAQIQALTKDAQSIEAPEWLARQ